MPNQTEQNLPLLVFLAALRAQGVEKIVVAYNGQDDSGSIESTDCFPAGSYTLSVEEQDTIETFVDQHAIPKVDWWNNAGGHGTATIDLATMQVHVAHTQRTENEAFDYASPGDWGDQYVDTPTQHRTVEVS